MFDHVPSCWAMISVAKKTSSFCLTHPTLKFDTEPSLPWIECTSHLAMLRKCPMTAGDKALDGVHRAWSCTLLQFHWMGGTTWRHWIPFEYVCVEHVWVSFPWNLIEPTFTYLNLTAFYSFLPNNSEMGSAQQKNARSKSRKPTAVFGTAQVFLQSQFIAKQDWQQEKHTKLMMTTETRYQYLGNVILHINENKSMIMKCFFWTASALPAWQSTFKIRGMMAIEDIRNPTSGGCLRGVQDQLEDMMVGMHCKEFQHLALVVLDPFFVGAIYILYVKPFQQCGCTQFFGWWTAHLPWFMQS